MARKKDTQAKERSPRKRPGAPGGAIRRRGCWFCKEGIEEIDYKNYSQLRRYMSERGKIRSRRVTGACRKHQRLRARQEARTAEQAEQIAEVLSKTVLRFEVQAGPRGRLFGSVTPTAIADEVWRARKIRVDRKKIRLDDPIKRIGRYDVPIEVFQDVVVEVKTMVVPEGGELPSEEELAAFEAEERAEQERAELEAAEAAGPGEPPA